VLPDHLGLFRAKLLIQIFPEPGQYFFTFHPSNPHDAPSLLDTCLLNSEEAGRVPERSEGFVEHTP
jgi:hypothetical protein